MIELQQTPGTNIISMTAKGEVTGDDYENVITPAIQATLKQYDKIRLLFVLGEEYEGFAGEAMWDDTKEGIKEFTHFEKIGMVSDMKWVHRSMKAFGFLVPGEVKCFGNDQMAEAERWIAA